MNPSTYSVVRNSLGLTLLSATVALLSGCSSGPESHVVSAPPPAQPVTTQVIVAQPAQQPVVQQTSNGTLIVTQAPPAVQAELVSAQPTSDHKWVAGYWTYSSNNSRYEWVAGHWELPPTRSSVWVAPRWERTTSGAYRFYEGYWN